MKAILLECYQDTAAFPVPPWFDSRRLTFPLPPYSTVIGMIHAACGWSRYHPLKISVSGNGIENQTITRMWKGGLVGSETEEFKKRFPVRFPAGNDKVAGFVDVPTCVDFITDLSLKIYISADNEQENLEIMHGLLYPRHFLSLGRYEDVVRVDNVQEVDVLDSKSDDVVAVPFDSYVPRESVYNSENESGTVFRLHKDYEIIRGRRIFNDIQAYLISKGAECRLYSPRIYEPDGNFLYMNSLLIDKSSGNPVFFA